MRARGRVMATVLTLGTALTLVISMVGFTSFAMHDLLLPRFRQLSGVDLWFVAPFDVMGGMSAFNDLETIELSSEFLADLRETLAGKAQIAESSFVIVPELSFLGPTHFSMMYSPEGMRVMGALQFSFTEGDWESAMPILEQGCGVLTSPAVVKKNNAALYDTIMVSGAHGPVSCTIAGIGSTLAGASIISNVAAA